MIAKRCQPMIALLLLSMPVLLFTSSVVHGEETTKRPNILFIYTDDHSHRTVGCYPEAYDWVRTPNIDALAKTRRPLHARLHRHLVHAVAGHAADRASCRTASSRCGWRASIPAARTIPSSARSGRACFASRATTPPRSASGTPAPTPASAATGTIRVVWNRPRYPDNAGHYYYNQLIETNGGKAETGRGLLDRQLHRLGRRSSSAARTATPKKPWYLWLCYGAVHGPFTPAKRHLERLSRHQGADAGRHLSAAARQAGLRSAR